MRASDAERETVVGQLRYAHGEGRLTLTEFDERVQAVWAARTYGELTEITADLPSVTPAVLPSDVSPEEVRPRPRSNGERTAMRIVASAWFAASLVNIVIWGLVCLTSGHWVYPWWVWVAGPWGAAILAGRLGGLGRKGRLHD
jgi:hypothetical protein